MMYDKDAVAIKIERNNNTALFFLGLIWFGVAFTIMFILPVLHHKTLSIVYGWIVILMLIFFMLSTIVEPGYVKPDKKFDFQYLLDNLDPVYLWPDWMVIRTPRSRHWNLWNRWTDRYDHHWPYINNWVGYRNHIYFVIFLILIWIILVLQVVVTAMSFCHDPKSNSWEFLENDLSTILYYIFSIVVILLCSLFLIAVLLLTLTHICNFFVGKTTHERYSQNKKEEESLLESNHNSSGKESSLLQSALKSDILVHDDTQMQSFNYVPNPKISESYIGKKPRKWCWANFWNMLTYKQPTQAHSKRLVEKYMKQR